MSNQTDRDCPSCYGSRSLYRLDHPRRGDPRWQCRHCNYIEPLADNGSTPNMPPPRILTAAEIDQVRRGYTAVAHCCAELLWLPMGTTALNYLYKRGLTD